MSDTPAGGLRVVLDLRALQEPERSPITAAYLTRLAAAFAASPDREVAFVAVVRALRPHPLGELQSAGLALAGRRVLPPTARLLRSAALSIDALLLRAALARTGGRVFHAAGGALPSRSPVPVVATLLDLAAWELPERYARTPGSRLARRLRAAALERAQRVLVTSSAIATAAVSLLGLDEDRVVVVPLAADEAFSRVRDETDAGPASAREHGLPPRYLVVGGRYDARSDLRTVLQALAALRRQAAPTTAAAASPAGWPPRLVLIGAGGHERRGRNRVEALVEHFGVDDLVHLTPPLSDAQRAAVTAGAAGHVQAALSDAVGLAALDALAAGVPVLASRVGCLPEVVGSAGILVEPRDVARMVSAMRAVWDEGDVALSLRRAALARARASSRSWADVAAETLACYREAAVMVSQDQDRA